jgi:sterol desaturase/sphingolipid hydroxylase (fatty acid hydroxylase superfamily)
LSLSLSTLGSDQADQYHYVHHAKFECNYGSPFSAFIDQYFGTFREKLGDSKQYTGGASGAELEKEAEKESGKKGSKVRVGSGEWANTV